MNKTEPTDKRNPEKNNFPVDLVWILFSFVLWVFLFRHFISSDIAISIDTNTNYAVTKYYFNNLLNGLIPLWDPFLYLGVPFGFIGTCGVINPITYLIVILHYLGMNYYESYLIYLVVYYFVGLIGFYLLSKSLFKDKLVAFISYLLFLFSGAGASIFNQIYMLLIFVPAVWFFYFLINFGRFFQKSHFLGLTFMAMLIFVSYIPFYFSTLFLIFLISFCCIYRQSKLKDFSRGFLNFIQRNKAVFLLCILSVCISLIPLFLYKSLNSSGDVVAPSRHCDFVGLKDCFEITLHGSPQMSYPEACSGSLGWRMSFRSLFSHLDKLSYAPDALFYLPIFSYILIFISLFTIFSKRMLLFISVGFFIFLIALADVTPLHRFLYTHVFYFKYFRNFFFFMVYLMPIIALLSANQLKSMLELKSNSLKEKHNMLILIFVLHFFFFVFLIKQGDIIITSYITVFGSMLFFTLYFAGYLKGRKSYVVIGLFLLCVLQPFEVFNAYSRHAAEFTCNLPSRHVYPQFSFKRPSKKVADNCLVYKHIPEYSEFWHDMTMEDSTGHIGRPGSLARWTFALSGMIDDRLLMDYARNKFVVYDEVEYLDELQKESIGQISNAFKEHENKSFISSASVSFENNERLTNPKAFVLSGNSENFRVLQFDANSLKLLTNFSARKFLVYNDSFTSYWKVFINGKSDKIYRANIAFKGVWLPPGKNIVYFKYESPGGEGIYIFVTIYFGLFLMYTLFMLNKEKVFKNE